MLDLELAYSCWSTYDVDNSGSINVRELDMVITALGANHSETDVNDLMLCLDIDSDGEVNFVDFIRARTHKVGDQSVAKMMGMDQITKMRKVFFSFDSDGSGNVDKEELEKVMKKLGQSISQWEMSQLMSMMDYDGSGQINWFEFIRGMARIQKATIEEEETIMGLEEQQEKLMEDLSMAEEEKDTTLDAIMSKGKVGMHWASAMSFQPAVPQLLEQGHPARLARPSTFNAQDFLKSMSSVNLPSLEEEAELASQEAKPKLNGLLRQRTVRPAQKNLNLNEGRSLNLFDKDHKFRILCFRILSHWLFELTILFLIALSSIMLAIESPDVQDSSTLGRVLFHMDLIFTVLFTLEMIIKIIVCGFWSSKTAYLRSGWNVLDSLIVLNSLCTVAVLLGTGGSSSGLSFLRVARLLRALRPLRAISRGGQLRIVVNTLISSAFALVNLVVMVLFVGYIFGILGLELFAGGFHSCKGGGYYYNMFAPVDAPADVSMAMTSTYSGGPCTVIPQHMDPQQLYLESGNFSCYWSVNDCEDAEGDGNCFFVPVFAPAVGGQELTSLQDCGAQGYRWLDSIINFNSIGKVFITLFIVSTGEGWVEVMHQTMDIAGREDRDEFQPRNIEYVEDNRPLTAFFFVIFICMTNFFLLKLFTGAVYTYYIQQRDEDENLDHLTKSQREWMDMQILLEDELARIHPPRALSTLQGLQHRVLESAQYSSLVVLLIIFQIIITASTYDGMSDAHANIYAIYTNFMTVLLVLELVSKFHIYGFREVMKDKWVRFDILVACLAALELMLCARDFFVFNEVVEQRVIGISTLRILRVGRFFRHVVGESGSTQQAFVRSVKKLQIILETFLSSLPSLLNMAIILLVFQFMFGVLGMNIFGSLRVEESMTLSDNVNFSNIYYSLLTLFRVSTGEDWQNLYKDLVWMQCSADRRIHHPEDCGVLVQFLFFLFYFLVNVFVIMNLFVAIMIEIFAGVVSREYSDLAMEHVSDWVGIWGQECEFDESGESYLNVKSFKAFLKKVDQPLGVGQKSTDKQVLQRVHELQIQVTNGKIYFQAPLFQAVKRVAKALNPATRTTNKKYLEDTFISQSYISVLLGAGRSKQEAPSSKPPLNVMSEPASTSPRDLPVSPLASEEKPMKNQNTMVICYDSKSEATRIL
ncbi:Caveolin-2 [Cymbomonas tetramitiformis]|uniref:Caveolin-2 n=1 Tax=Cymbomonas tetramitiformis TaxID=36881 RepID=A0AAE0F7N9_9CHLO|nr:Caveolin-2 [Cymbomonas tetramitiformis]